MACVLAGITVSEFLGYLAAVEGVTDIIETVGKVASDVTHAYDKGTQIVNTTRATYKKTREQVNRARRVIKSTIRKFKHPRKRKTYARRQRKRR